MKKNKYYIFIAIVLFLIYAIYHDINSNKLLISEGKYTIGYIKKITGGGKGCGMLVYVGFNYKHDKYEENYCESSDEVKRMFVGQRFFIKILPSNVDRRFDIKYSCPVPDSINVAPYEGWSQQWMKDNFPNCEW